MNEQLVMIVSVLIDGDEAPMYYVGLNPERSGSTLQTWTDDRNEATLLPRKQAEKMVEDELEPFDLHSRYFIQWTDEHGRQTREADGVTIHAPVGIDEESFFAAFRIDRTTKQRLDKEHEGDISDVPF